MDSTLHRLEQPLVASASVRTFIEVASFKEQLSSMAQPSFEPFMEHLMEQWQPYKTTEA